MRVGSDPAGADGCPGRASGKPCCGSCAARTRTTPPWVGGPYGLALVCRVWGVARSTVYRHREPPRAAAPRRPGPVGPMPDAELLEAVRAVLAASPFHGEGHRKVWARLRH